MARWYHPPCFRRPWGAAAELRGVFRLLAWHSVMETTMEEPVWRGVFTPWHQSWHRAHPGYSAGWRGFSDKPSLPCPSIHPPPRLKLHFLPTFLSFASPLHLSHTLCLFLPQSLSISSLLLAPQRQPFTHGT